MTNLSITLSGEAFEALFPLRANHLNPSASWSNRDGQGCLFETYGADHLLDRGLLELFGIDLPCHRDTPWPRQL